MATRPFKVRIMSLTRKHAQDAFDTTTISKGSFQKIAGMWIELQYMLRKQMNAACNDSTHLRRSEDGKTLVKASYTDSLDARIAMYNLLLKAFAGLSQMDEIDAIETLFPTNPRVFYTEANTVIMNIEISYVPNGTDTVAIQRSAVFGPEDDTKPM